MLVIKIIAILLLALIVYALVDKFNSFTYKKFNYQFFELDRFFIIAFSYALLFFGSVWYKDALRDATDPLNGIVLITIGVVILLTIVYKNFKNTNFTVGLFGSIFQLVVFAIITPVSIFALVIAAAFAMETRPVYRIKGTSNN